MLCCSYRRPAAFVPSFASVGAPFISAEASPGVSCGASFPFRLHACCGRAAYSPRYSGRRFVRRVFVSRADGPARRPAAHLCAAGQRAFGYRSQLGQCAPPRFVARGAIGARLVVRVVDVMDAIVRNRDILQKIYIRWSSGVKNCPVAGKCPHDRA